MSIGIMDDDEFQRELEKLNGASHTTSIPTTDAAHGGMASVIDINRGRNNKPETPESVRKIIAEEAIEGASHRSLSEIFNVSESSVSAYKVGATSTTTYHDPQPELKKQVRSVRQRIAGKASKVLRQSLGVITPEALAEIGPVKAAAIARDMSTIVRNMDDGLDEDNGKVVNNTIFYAPRLASEDSFEYLEVDESGQVLRTPNS